MVEKTPQHANEITAFMFINPISGLRYGETILEGGVSSLNFSDLGTIFLYNITSTSSKESGIQHVKEFQQHSAVFPYIVIAGGDGTFIGIMEQLSANGIDLLKANFCVLPFGTGNDLAQVTGWGSGVDGFAKTTVVKTLKCIMSELKNATISQINVWEIDVKCAVFLNLLLFNLI